jgi:hypothetical protein
MHRIDSPALAMHRVDTSRRRALHVTPCDALTSPRPLWIPLLLNPTGTGAVSCALAWGRPRAQATDRVKIFSMVCGLSGAVSAILFVWIALSPA